MQRYIYTFLRFLVFLIIPFIIGPIIATDVLLSATTYTSSADLWVQTSLYSDPQQASQGQTYTSPAKQFGDQLTELLSTRNFVGSLIDGTELKNNVKTESARLNLIDDLSKNIKIEASGWSLIKISYSDKNPQTSLSVISSTVSTFLAYYSDNISQQENTATTYYDGLVKSSKIELDKATKTVEDFLAANPNKIGSEGASKAVTQEDIQYGLLTQNRDAARKTYDDAVANLAKTKNTFGAIQQGQGTTLTIKDPPQVADNKTSKIRQIALGIGIGLVAGGLVSGLITVLLTLFDNKLRLVSTAQQVLRVRRVLALPDSSAMKYRPKTLQTPTLLDHSQNSARNFVAANSNKVSSNVAVNAISQEDELRTQNVNVATSKTYDELDSVAMMGSSIPVLQEGTTLTIKNQPAVFNNRSGESGQSELKLGLGLIFSGLKVVLLNVLDNKSKIQTEPSTHQAKNEVAPALETAGELSKK